MFSPLEGSVALWYSYTKAVASQYSFPPLQPGLLSFLLNNVSYFSNISFRSYTSWWKSSNWRLLLCHVCFFVFLTPGFFFVFGCFCGIKCQGWRDPFNKKVYCIQGAACPAKLPKGMCFHDIIGFECAVLSIMCFFF